MFNTAGRQAGGAWLAFVLCLAEAASVSTMAPPRCPFAALRMSQCPGSAGATNFAGGSQERLGSGLKSFRKGGDYIGNCDDAQLGALVPSN